jgi:hypothetical protein
MKSTPSRFWPLAAYGAVLAAGATGAAWSAYIFIREVMQRLHPMTFIAFVFRVTGLAVASAGLRGLRRVLSGTEGPAPATGVVPSDGNPREFRAAVLWLNAFTLMVVACMAYAFMHVSDAFARVVVAILGVAFGGSGIGYALMAKRKSREWESFGETTLRISPHVPQTGAPLEGTIAFERGVAPGAAFNVSLVCQKAARDSDFPGIADGIQGASVATDLCERFASALRLDRAKVASIEYATTNVQRFKQARSARRSPLAQQETP